MFTNYVIPNEYFMLQEVTQTEGICVTVLENDSTFLASGSLKIIWQSDAYPNRDYFLIAHKKQQRFFELLVERLADIKVAEDL